MAYPLPEDDQFWKAAMDMDMRLTVHVAFDRNGDRANQPTFIYPDENPEIMSKVKRGVVDEMARLGLRSATSFSQMIASGVFDRLPDMRIFFAEKVSKKGGVGGPVALASGYENTYPLPNRPE